MTRRSLVLAALAVACAREASSPPAHSHGAASPPAAAPAVAYYTCPMHASVRAAEPGRCPMCGMDLVPVAADQAATGAVQVDEARRATWGIRTAPAAVAPLRRTIRLAGVVGWDLQRQRDVVVRAAGTVEGLRVAVGSVVRAGDALFFLRSPELVAAQRDLAASGGGEAAELARARLRALGASAQQVEAVAAAGAVIDPFPVVAPVAGVVSELGVVEGSAVGPWTAPARIANAGSTWIDVAATEEDAALVPAGAPATVTVASVPGRSFPGAARPLPSAGEATQRLRVQVDNADGALRTGQVAVVTLEVDLGTGVVVPVDAVVYAGARTVVFVDAGAGQLEPRTVEVGARLGENVALLSGVAAGEVVVRDGAFLVAAESRVRAPAAWAGTP